MSFLEWLKGQYRGEKGPIKWLAFLFDLLASTALFFLMVLTCIDVFGRYLFNSPVRGGTELTEMGLAIVILSALPIVTWRSGQIVVDLIDHLVSPRVISFLSWISTILITVSLYFVGSRIFEIGARKLKRGEVTEFLRIPEGYIIQYIAAFCWLTAICLLLVSLSKLFIKK